MKENKIVKEFKRVVQSSDLNDRAQSALGNNLPILSALMKESYQKEKIQREENIRLFLTGFLQVFFVAVNTYFITQQLFVGVFIVSFLISFIWSFNVRKVVFGNLKDRIIYSLGASIGGLSGLLLATQYSKISYLLSLI